MELKSKVPFNLSIIVGMIAMSAVVSVAIFHATNNLLLLLNFSAIVIVFGGVTASALVIQPLTDLKYLMIKIYKYMRFEYDPSWRVAASLAHAAVQYSQTKSFRKLGAIQNKRLFDALELVESGMRKEDIRSILETKREASISQSLTDAGLLLTLAKLAPGYGLVGTLIGLVVLLYDLGSGNFDKVGPAMALALLATLYGVLIANVIFMPLAEFITHRAETVGKMDDLVERGVFAILDGRHPIQIREMIRAYLSYYEQEGFDTELQRLRDQDYGAPVPPVNKETEAKVG